MSAIAFLGFLAGILTTVAFVPQVIRTWQLKSAKDFSLGMLVTFISGVFLWLIYGILIQSWPVIIANFFTFILASIILWFKLHYQ